MVYTFGPQDKDPNKEETESEKEKKCAPKRFGASNQGKSPGLW